LSLSYIQNTIVILKRNLNLVKNIEKATIATIELQIVAYKQDTKRRNKSIDKIVDIVKYVDNSLLLCNLVIVLNIEHVIFKINKIKLY